MDLDGTLAVHQAGEVWDGSIGPPVPLMVAFVKRLIKNGTEVRIMTARVAPVDLGVTGDLVLKTTPDYQRGLIESWCQEHLGVVLPVTCCKDYFMATLYDDRARQVERNTGVIL